MKPILRFTALCLSAAFALTNTGCKDDETKTDDTNRPEQPITLTAAHALGAYNPHVADDKSACFRLVLSESEVTGTADAPVFSGSGQYAFVVLYAAEQQTGMLPEGTYPLAGSKPAAGQGSIADCRYGVIGTSENAGGGKQERLLDGSVTVSRTGNNYKIELSATLTRSRTLSCVYEGAITFEIPAPVYDIDFDAHYALGSYESQTQADGSSNYILTVSNIEIDGEAEDPIFSEAGELLTLDLYAIGQTEGELPEGTYTLVAGEPVKMQGSLEGSGYGTADATGEIGDPILFKAATATVAREQNSYRIEVLGTLEDGRTLRCNFEGAIPFTEKAEPGPSYDINLKARFGLGIIYSQVMEDNSSNFFLTLSNVEVEGDAEDPIFSTAGKFLMVDLYAIEREEGILPEGTYPFTAEMPSDMQGSYEYTLYGQTDATGEITDDQFWFNEASATVSYTDDGYKIEIAGILDDGRTLHCEYEGMIDFASEGGGDISLPGLQSDINAAFTIAQGAYLGTVNTGSGQYAIDLFDNDIEQNFKTTNRLSLTLFSAAPAGTIALTPGTYTINTSGALQTLYPGSLNTQTFQVTGSYCEQTLVNGEDYKLLYGMITAGEVNIAVSGSAYTITADLTDVDGHSIKGTYQGEIAIADKSYASTIDADVNVDLTGMPCELTYYADYFGVRGDNWSVFIGTEADGTEAFQIELISPVAGFSAGLPAGEYTVMDLNDYQSGGLLCVPGVKSGTSLYNSWYLADYQDGSVYNMAPFTTGKVTVARTGDRYTFDVEIYDDQKPARKVTGTWSGTPSVYNDSGAQDAPQRKAVESAPAKGAKSALSVREQVQKHAVKAKPATRRYLRR